MLSYKMLRNHAVIADHTPLIWLYEVIHHVNEHSRIVKGKQGSFLGLAHDVCRA